MSGSSGSPGSAPLALCLHTLPSGSPPLAALLHWRSWEQLPAVLTWAGLIATWFLVQARARTGRRLAPGGLADRGGRRDAARRSPWRRSGARAEIKAGTGSRAMLAALLVLVWPWTAWWEWPLYAYGLWLTSSWVAGLALLVAVAVRYPVAAPYAGAGLGLVVLLFAIPWTRRQVIDQTPRGSSLDGLRERLRTWAAMLRLLRRWPIWLVGAGPEPAGRRTHWLKHDLTREGIRLSAEQDRDVSMVASPTHCEPLEYAYTYGILGMAAMAALTWHLVPRLALGDPWTASALAGLVIALAAIPARVAPVGLVWWVTLAVIGGRA